MCVCVCVYVKRRRRRESICAERQRECVKEYIYEKRLRVYFIVRLFVRYVCREIERERRSVYRNRESVCKEIERLCIER